MVWTDARTTVDYTRDATGETALTSADAAEEGPGGRPARFLVLGMLTVADGRDAVALQPSRPAALLAALLLRANSVVSAEYLQRVIWGERAPAQGKSALHSCVLRLRRLFGKYGIAGNSIEAVSGGYRLIADAGTLDLVEFRELLAGAYSDPDPGNELRMLRRALDLWQPPLLANVHSELLHRDEVPRLTEEWLRAIERVFDLELAGGCHREALAEIAATARSHPLHERFTEQLMEALRRAGRRAEALSEYRQTKVRLAQQLGVDPGPALQRLELEILRGEPAAGAVAPPVAGRLAEAAGGHHGMRGGSRGGAAAGTGPAPASAPAPSGAAGAAGRTGGAAAGHGKAVGAAQGAGAPAAAPGRALPPAADGGSPAVDASAADSVAVGSGPGGARAAEGPHGTAGGGSGIPGTVTGTDSATYSATGAGAGPVTGSDTGMSTGTVTGTGTDCDGAESAADDPPVTGERVLDRLVRAGLLEEGPHGHYRMNDLLTAFARAAAAEGVGARARTARARHTPHTPTHLHPTEA